MKKLLSILVLLPLMFPIGRGQVQDKQTPANLQVAYVNELKAATRYAAYAKAARKENLPLVARLFEATSKAEAIHAANHKRVMEVTGAPVTEPVLPEFQAKSTRENLLEAIRGELWEADTLYPDFLKTAIDENVSEAIVSFRYALQTEKKHAALYQQVLNALEGNHYETIPRTWYVCPTCGNTYEDKDVALSCEFCGTLKPRFIVFNQQ
jgi:rubrerythrin